MRRTRWLLALALLAAMSACTGSPRAASVTGAGRTAAEVPTDLVPPSLVGLRTEQEDVSALEEEAGDDSYLASTRLWSLRENERLRATLQIGRFVPDAGGTGEKEERDFRLRIVSQIGQTAPRLRVLGGEDVYVTVANSQPVYVWFRSRLLFVLSVDKSVVEPRTLLREALELAE
ncbi:MAG TPA: hypothetical protein VMY88_09860 [Acidimicrobiales bacterium]|nr:hypothetical protein [Acidimicrobiales bacterium]